MGALTPEDTEVELTPADLASYTKGRLPADDPETANLLSRALAGARRYCGWVVTPAVTATMYLDGPGTRDLSLPTMNMTALLSCTENGISLDVSPTAMAWSRQGIVRKTVGGPHCGQRWTHQLGSIQIEITHGYSVADADDWRGAVLEACDLAAQNVGPQLQQYTVDDVQRNWFKVAKFAFDTAILDPYRLMGVA
jgi:hypothetical protein